MMGEINSSLNNKKFSQNELTKDNSIHEKIRSILLEDKKEITEEAETAIKQAIEISEGNSDITEIMNWFEEKRKKCNIETEVCCSPQ